MSPESVLLVTPLWGRDGGVAAHVQDSANLLAGHGLEVRVLAARVQPGQDTSGITVYESPDLFDVGSPIDQRLGAALSSRPAIVHFHQFDDPEAVEAIRRSAPVVVSAHGYTGCTVGVHYFRPGQECTRPHGLGCVANIVLRGCAHTRHVGQFPLTYGRVSRRLHALRRADLAVAYSSAVDRHLAANGIVRRRIVQLFTTTPPAAGSRQRTPGRVVFAGRMVAAKGVGVLIHAAREVDAEFVLCGDGRMLEPMRRLARRLAVEERVSFRGWLDARSVASELARASVVAVPSLWPEPFGLVGIEAFAAGRPVVASATGGILDWLQDGVNGLAAKPGDAQQLARALTALLDDPQRQDEMGARGRELVAERFSPERHLESLLDAYRAARSSWLAQRGGSTPTARLDRAG